MEAHRMRETPTNPDNLYCSPSIPSRFCGAASSREPTSQVWECYLSNLLKLKWLNLSIASDEGIHLRLRL